MLLTIIMAFAAILLVAFAASRLRPDIVEWSVYLFLLGLAIMPSRIRILMILPNSTVSALDLYLWAFLLLFLLIRGVRPRPPRVDEVVIGLPLGLFCGWAYFSGAASGYPGSFWAVSTALVKWVPAFLACWVGVSILPRTPEGMRRFEAYFKALCGLVIAPQIILTAFNLGGWDTYASQEDAGFLRGWSCIGSGIVTAACVLPAYFLALRDFFTGRRNQNLAILLAGVVFLAVLFTLARSVMALLIIGSISVTVHYSHRSMGQMAVFVAIVVVFGFGLWVGMSQLSFSRLESAKGESTDLRIESLMGSLEIGLKQPIWGHGFGCFYDQVRQEGSIRKARETINVAGRESALEPHNAYALCWAETGVVGLGIFLWLLHGFRRHMPLFRWNAATEDYTERTIWWIMIMFFMSGSGILLYQIPTVFLSLPFMLVFFSTSVGAGRHG